jgi:3-dehydroquinate dehydratase-2
MNNQPKIMTNAQGQTVPIQYVCDFDKKRDRAARRILARFEKAQRYLARVKADTLDDIATRLEDRARLLDLTIAMRRSNHEGHLVDWLHEAQSHQARAVLLNAGAFTHTSVALYDAIKAIRTPVIEVHLSNPHARESFRHRSFVGRAAKGTVAGFGALSYMLALEAAATL